MPCWWDGWWLRRGLYLARHLFTLYYFVNCIFVFKTYLVTSYTDVDFTWTVSFGNLKYKNWPIAYFGCSCHCPLLVHCAPQTTVVLDAVLIQFATRIKEILITAGGENVPPFIIEDMVGIRSDLKSC